MENIKCDNNITELVFILDKSGSMAHLTDDTIGGFNGMLARQKADKDGKVLVTTVLFNQESSILHDRLDISAVAPMTERDYCAGGCTALVDAIGSTVHHIVNIHRYARPEDVPGKTLFLITTDGLENASRRYTADQVRKLLRHEQEKYGWEFIFLGANIDSVETAARYGIDGDHAVNYHNDVRGTAVRYEAMDNAIRASRKRAPLAESGWRDSADSDFSSRGR